MFPSTTGSATQKADEQKIENVSTVAMDTTHVS